MYYSASTKGFYDENIHGARQIKVVDPAWQRPTIQIPDPAWNGDGDAPLITAPDESALPDMIDIDNPACTIPADARPISREQYNEIMSAQADGKVIQPDSNGDPVAIARITDLNTLKVAALRAIDTQAENTRLQFITPGAGQSMVYQRKVQEAETLALDNNPDAAHYPLLTAEVGITGETLQEVAATVLAKRDQWLAVAALIERTRLLAKTDIQAADTAARIDTIISGIVWPQP